MNLFRKKKRKKLIRPNILLTNHCNQHCSFCFAQKEMKKTGTQEMSMKDFRKVVKILVNNKVNHLRLLGGEPTIHSQFAGILRIGVKQFDKVVIFSNAVIPQKSRQAIEVNIEDLEFNFNIGTPVFSDKEGKEGRAKIIKDISDLSAQAKSSVAFTIFDLNQDYSELVKDFSSETLSNLGVAFSFAKSLYENKPVFAPDKYLELGKKIITTIQDLKDKGVERVYMQCGLKKSMFTQEQRQYLNNNTIMKDWGCLGKWGSFDIATDLSVFPCFPFYQEARLNLKDYPDLNKLNRKLRQIQQRKGSCLN